MTSYQAKELVQDSKQFKVSKNVEQARELITEACRSYVFECRPIEIMRLDLRAGTLVKTVGQEMI